jgi:hypothetical protein
MTFSKPALRISNVVRGRVSVRNRVFYFVDPTGKRTKRAIPEKVVLKRWCARTMAGFQFGGDRLPPTVWRGMPIAIGPDVSEWPRLTESDIGERIAGAREQLAAQKVQVPSAGAVHALIEACGVARLQQLIARHEDAARWESPGVPDLFLYARKSGSPLTSRFVEVKKPREPLLRSQVEELEFLIELGMPARVLRLSERS